MILDIKKMSLIKKDCALAAVCFLTVAIIAGTILGAATGEGNIMPVIMVIGGYTCISMFFKIIFLAGEVSRGLGFGMTRKKLFRYSRIYDFAELCIVLVILAILLRGEYFSLEIRLGLLCFGVFMWVQGLAGNAIVVFGRTAYVIYYFSFLALCILLPKVFELSATAQNFAIWFLDAIAGDSIVSSLGALVVILIFVAAGLLVNWTTFRKLPVVQSV